MRRQITEREIDNAITVCSTESPDRFDSGRVKEKKELVCRLIRNGQSDDKIKQLTGVSREFINSLRMEIGVNRILT